MFVKQYFIDDVALVVCPECKAALMAPGAVEVALTINDVVITVKSRLDSEGRLQDTNDQAVAKGFHSATRCAYCLTDLAEYEGSPILDKLFPGRKRIQVDPDWIETWTASQSEQELVEFVFRGPGLYLADDTTMLVLPADPEEHPFACLNKPDRLWRFYVWESPFSDTVLSLTDIPVRQDDRKEIP